MKLIYCKTLDDYYKISGNINYKNHVILTSNNGLIKKLIKLKILFIDEFSFLCKKEIKETYLLSYDLSKKWSSAILNKISIDFKLNIVSSAEMYWFFQSCINSFKVYNKIITNYNIEEVIFIRDLVFPILRTGPSPIHKNIKEINKGVFKFLLDQSKIKFHDIIHEQSNLKKSKFKFPNLFKFPKINRHVYDSYQLVYNQILYDSETNFITNSNEIFLKSNTILVSASSLELISNTQMKKDEIDFKIPNHFFETYNYIFKNKYLKFQFNGLVDEINKGFLYGSYFNALQKLYKSNFVFLGYDSFSKENIISQVSTKNGLRNLSFVHTGLFIHDDFRFFSGNFSEKLIWNNYDELTLKKTSDTNNLIHKIGAVRYKKLKESYIKKYENININKKSIKNVLILTGPLSIGFSHITANQKSFIKDLDDIIAFLLKKNFNITIRNHPSYDNHSIYGHLDKNIKIDNSNSLLEQIKNFDFAINLNYLSTSVLECMMSLKPVILYSNSIYFFKGIGTIPEITNFKIDTINDLDTFISNLNNSDFLMKVLNTQNKIINELVGDNLENVNNKIQNILKTKKIKKIGNIKNSVIDFVNNSGLSKVENNFICFYFLGSINYGFKNSCLLLKKNIQNSQIDKGLLIKLYFEGFFSKSFFKSNFSDLIIFLKIKLYGNKSYSFYNVIKFYIINLLVFFKSK